MTRPVRMVIGPDMAGRSIPGALPDTVEPLIDLTHRPPEPHALSFSRLPGGAALLCSAHAGGDIDAVYLPGGPAQLQHLWPIDAWGSPSWAADGDLLPDPGGRFDRELLVAFAREHPSRVAPFLADVRRLFASPAGRQIVLAENTTETVARWIALACASLPDGHARALTFTTRTASPHRAPQQILGIGPDADFDRSDTVTVEHLYRVHDGLGGHGSAPLSDPWAELTARLWLAGMPPSPPADGEPFGLARPMETLLSVAETADWGPRAFDEDGIRAVVAELAGSASPADEELTRFCRHLGRHWPAAVIEPLALALARRRLAAPGVRTVEDLPLDADALRALRREHGTRLEEELSRRVRGPIAEWFEALELLLGLGSGTSPVVDEDVAARLAEVLLDPAHHEHRDAADLLSRLADIGLTRRVLERLAASTPRMHRDALFDVVAAPGGDWIRRNIAEAPHEIRLVDAAARLCADPGGPCGIDLYTRLADLLPGGVMPDARILRLVWQLAWPDGHPGTAEMPVLVRTSPPRLIVEAGRGDDVAAWLTNPARIDDALVEFASEVLRERWPTESERATAEMIVVSEQFARDGAGALRTLNRIRALQHDAAPLAPAIREGTAERLAIGLARADPVELHHDDVLTALVGDGGEAALGRRYRDAALSGTRRQERIDQLVRHPRQAADLFYALQCTAPGDVAEWRRVCDELLAEILGPALERMESRQRHSVSAAIRQFGDDWLRAWERWQRKRAATSPEKGPA